MTLRWHYWHKQWALTIIPLFRSGSRSSFKVDCMWEKQISARAIRIPKRKLGGGGATHLSEIFELKFGKKMPYSLHFEV